MMKYMTVWFLNAFDYICTLYLTGRFGLTVEANPIGLFLLQHPVLLFITKIGGVTAALWWMSKHKDSAFSNAGIWMLLIAYGLLALYHTTIIIHTWCITGQF